VTRVVIDASAGVELVADTVRGRALRALLPSDAVPWVPEVFYVECGAVLRRWDLNSILTPAQIARAIAELMAWPLRVTQYAAWSPTPGDSERTSRSPIALYVALAEHLGADLLTDDYRLANTPNLPIRSLHLPGP
jgi:predicted nucleic acid-binding protein